MSLLFRLMELLLALFSITPSAVSWNKPSSF
jgi:hypothetical protein